VTPDLPAAGLTIGAVGSKRSKISKILSLFFVTRTLVKDIHKPRNP
jgi:hypothetical protein